MSKKITDLTALTTADSSDVVPIEDISANTTKKITVGGLTTTVELLRPRTFEDESTFDFVSAGCVWTGDAYGSTRAASMTAGAVYIDGVRIALSAVTARVFTASRDTYVDVGSDGVIDYNEVTNNAASPALAAGHIRIGIIVTGSTNILNVGSINQGETDKMLPVASSVAYTVADSLGNLICNRNPNPEILCVRRLHASANTTATSATQITGLSAAVRLGSLPRKVEVTLSGRGANSSAGNDIILGLWRGTVGSGTQIGESAIKGASIDILPVYVPGYDTTSGDVTYNASFNTLTSGTLSIASFGPGTPILLTVRRV